MNRLALLALIFLTCTACFNHEQHSDSSLLETAYFDFEIKYAKGFSIHKSDSSRYLVTHDPEVGTPLDTLVLTGSASDFIRYFNRIIAQSTTHFSFLNQIQALDRLTGLCGIQFLNDQQKSSLLNTTEVCNAQGLDIEKIMSLNPDLVFVYPFGDKDKSKLNQLGMRTVYLTEYMEKSPLARAEWLKFFALITGQNPNLSGFAELEKEYLTLAQIHGNSTNSSDKNEINLESLSSKLSHNLRVHNSVAFNLPYGDVWDMPADNSISAQLVRDAGLDYSVKRDNRSGNLVFKLEEAYEVLSRAHYWVIIAARPAGFSMHDLLAENRIYKNFSAVQNKTVIFCNTETTPYFSQGPIEPNIMLRDLINCIAGGDAENKYFKMLR
jgi:iron complex transport system substrate-binding protein